MRPAYAAGMQLSQKLAEKCLEAVLAEQGHDAAGLEHERRQDSYSTAGERTGWEAEIRRRRSACSCSSAAAQRARLSPCVMHRLLWGASHALTQSSMFA